MGEWMHILRSSLISGSLVGIGTFIDQLLLSPTANLKRRKEMASGREGGGAGGPIQVQGCREGGGGS